MSVQKSLSKTKIIDNINDGDKSNGFSIDGLKTLNNNVKILEFNYDV